MIIDRKRNAIRGTISGFILKIYQLIIPFVIRTIFIYTLGIEYLGLNGLFVSILQVLNLAELGISSALVFSMYKPIVDNDKEKICGLMRLYREYYRIIGLVVLVIGTALIPFLPNLINGEVPNDINLYVIYLMNLSATVLSYGLFAYRNCLFNAYQRNDIVSLITIAVSTVKYGLQIVVLIFLKNYYAYLAIEIVYQIALNIVIALYSKKYFPELAPTGRVSKEDKLAINKKVRDLFTAKLGNVITTSVDTIVISAFLGLKVLAIYQNYYYVLNAVISLYIIFFEACKAGIGNSLIVKSEDENCSLLYNMNYIVFLTLCICCCCMLNSYDPFMLIWIKDKTLILDSSLVFMFVLYLIAYIVPRTLIVFKDAGGIWKEDRLRPLITAMTNLTVNLLLVQRIGLYGILASTIFSYLVVSFPWVMINVNKCMFSIHISKYLKKNLAYLGIIALCCLLTVHVCNIVRIDFLPLLLVVRFMISAIVSLIVFELVFWKSEENQYFVHIMKQVVSNRRR